MNASKFMDKQIMDLSRSKASGSNDDFIDLMNPIPANDDKIAESTGATKKEEILPSFDFQPIRPTGLPSRTSDSPPMGGGSGGAGAPRAWNSADSKSNSSPVRSYGYLGSIEPDKVILEKAYDANDAAVISEIDHTMKRYTDNILHAIDGLSARLSQVESRTRQLEHSMDDLKATVGNNHGSTDGNMRQLENILREVQSCMQDLKDKQETMDARIQLEKLQIPKVDQTPEAQNTSRVEPAQQPTPAPQQPNQQFPVASLQSLSGVSPNAPPPPQQRLQPPVQLSSQFPPPSIPAVPHQDAYFAPASQTQEAPNQQYALPPALQQQPHIPPPPPGAQHQQYHPGPPTPYPQGPQLPQQHQQPVTAVNPPAPPAQLQPPMAHHPEEAHMSSQPYPPTLRHPPPQPTSGPPPSQQFYSAPPPSHMYDSPTGRSSSGFSSSVYTPPSGPSEPYPYGGSSSHYGNNPPTKHQPHSSGSGGNYPQIPTARILPPAIPTASAVSGGSSSVGSGNKVPIDDVIDKVTNMGFPREQVRAAVRRLTENGQPVDLNVVLDKLMNDGDVQLPRGWFGR